MQAKTHPLQQPAERDVHLQRVNQTLGWKHYFLNVSLSPAEKLRGFLNYSELPIVVKSVEWSSSYSVPRSLLASSLPPCSNAVYSQDETLFLNKFIPIGTTWWQCRNDTNWGVNGKVFSPLQACSTHALQGLWFPVPGSFAAPKAERKKSRRKDLKQRVFFLQQTQLFVRGTSEILGICARWRSHGALHKGLKNRVLSNFHCWE